ncbi:hypothetical protein [Floridanema evergladense]|uniref:Lipoprotein n=1 Tax=Floridaenema evergladense BLCC-F167 TaxID=3153639 RepID=A0ABV4WL60_9CYAN
MIEQLKRKKLKIKGFVPFCLLPGCASATRSGKYVLTHTHWRSIGIIS